MSNIRVSGSVMFALIWVGQLVSVIGTRLASFALGVWVFQQTGSITKFALITLVSTVPVILVSVVSGALVDRWDRRWTMILSETGSALGTLAIAILMVTGWFHIWQLCVLLAFKSTCSAFQWPAYTAAIPLLVPKRRLVRVNGLIQTATAIAQVIAPTLGGVLLFIIRIEGVLALDFISFLVAIVTLLISRIPRPQATVPTGESTPSVLAEIKYGWRYITRRSGLFGLLIFFAITNFIASLVQLLITPLVLGFATAQTLGLIVSIGGCGMLAGGMFMSLWGGTTTRHMYNILLFSLIQGVVLFLSGLRPSALLIAAAAFVLLFCFSSIAACSQAIWQSKVALDTQGRMSAMRLMIGSSCVPLAYLIAGPLTERCFEPLLADGGRLSETVGHFIGTGPGRGIALLYILLGWITLLVTVAAYFYKPIRLLDEDLPDLIGNEVVSDVGTEAEL